MYVSEEVVESPGVPVFLDLCFPYSVLIYSTLSCCDLFCLKLRPKNPKDKLLHLI